MSRRTFLTRSVALLGAGWAGGGCVIPGGSGREVGLPVRLADTRVLRAERVDPLNGRCQYVAVTRSGEMARPVFHAKTGERVDMVIENHLPQPTTVHFHGLTLNEANDGAGFDLIPPGGSKRLRFEVLNRGGLYWIHSHAHGFTAEQVHAGLASLLVVHDTEDEALDRSLALAPGNRLALSFSDVRVAQGQVLPYAPTGDECLHGWFGNQMLVNGSAQRNLAVAPDWVRLQLLNACNARGLLLQFEMEKEGARAMLPFHLLGTDGGVLGNARSLERVFLYGAERVDIALRLPAGARVQAVSAAFDPRHQVKGSWQAHVHAERAKHLPLAAAAVCGVGATSAASIPDGARMPLFELQAEVAGRQVQGELPGQLSTLPQMELPLAAGGIEPTRRLRLDFDERQGFLIDNRPYRLDEPGYPVSRGAREIWEIRASPISMPHPMHLHGFQFRVLRRQGTFGPARALAVESNGRLPTDLGLKDTVVLWPNETLWLEVDFSLPRTSEFSGPQRYMFHCHNLEHEDGMMMRNLTIS